MSERKPQIAYAPVNDDGLIAVGLISHKREDVAGLIRGFLNASDWRIARVRIEIDKEKSGE